MDFLFPHTEAASEALNIYRLLFQTSIVLRKLEIEAVFVFKVAQSLLKDPKSDMSVLHSAYAIIRSVIQDEFLRVSLQKIGDWDSILETEPLHSDNKIILEKIRQNLHKIPFVGLTEQNLGCNVPFSTEQPHANGVTKHHHQEHSEITASSLVLKFPRMDLYLPGDDQSRALKVWLQLPLSSDTFRSLMGTRRKSFLELSFSFGNSGGIEMKDDIWTVMIVLDGTCYSSILPHPKNSDGVSFCGFSIERSLSENAKELIQMDVPSKGVCIVFRADLSPAMVESEVYLALQTLQIIPAKM